MNKKSKNKKLNSSLLFLLIFSVLMIAIIFQFSNKTRKLPIYNPVDVNPRLVDSSVRNVSHGHKIANFNLINQNGKIITEKDFKNKIYIADFFFTRCTTICPIMSTNMASIQETFKTDSDIMFLSMSVTPKIDSIPVLKQYAKKKGAITGKWHITTGDKKHIYDLARKSFMAVLDEGEGGEQDFIHTEQFILIDKKQQIRGFYDGTDPKDIEILKNDILILKKEYE